MKLADCGIGQGYEDGYINLTFIVQASGTCQSDYLRLDTTELFVNELSMDTEIPASNLAQICRVI